MNPNLAKYLIALADDELICGHRLSEWTGHAPILEEDIAFANLALDEIGHARLWLELSAVQGEEDVEKAPDKQVFFRKAEQFRNLQMLELPNRDWAFSMLRQYLFDSLESVRLGNLKNSSENTLAEIANKIAIEETYHLRHSQAWMKRLALGTEESAMRSQRALDALWPYTKQLGVEIEGEAELVGEGITFSSADIENQWREQVEPFLGDDCELKIPDISDTPILTRSVHTEHLENLLRDMQEVARIEPEGTW